MPGPDALESGARGEHRLVGEAPTDTTADCLGADRERGDRRCGVRVGSYGGLFRPRSRVRVRERHQRERLGGHHEVPHDDLDHHRDRHNHSVPPVRGDRADAGPGCQNVQGIPRAPWHHRRPGRSVVHVNGPFDGVRLLYVATPFRPPLHREGREHIPQVRCGVTPVPDGILSVFFVGFAALLLVPNLQDPDMALLEVVKRTYPSWFLCFIGAAGAVSAMVPAAVLTLTAATLFAKNVLQQAVKPDMSDSSVTMVSRLSVIGITAIALFFAILLPSALVNLLLIGYNGVTQFLPGVLFAILGLRVSPSAVGAGIGVTAFLMEKSLPYGLFTSSLDSRLKIIDNYWH